jgi:polysaccharide deacetylase 2 family uncharacterized protein YibQ
MKDLKNLFICFLSLIIIIQGVLLFYLLRRGQVPAKKPMRRMEEARPAPPPVFKPRAVVGKIVLVLDDWGYNLKDRGFITDNDFHVTLSILPFKPYSTQIAELAHTKNKDVIVHMPMEPHNKENYGLEEHTLLTSMDRATVDHLLDAAFESVPFAKGLSNHMGSKATEDETLMSMVLSYLKNKNRFFLDSFVTAKTVGRGLARKMNVGFAQRDVFIDNNNDANSIKEQMLKLAQKARKAGVAVGIGHDRPVTVGVLKEMIPRLEKEGYQFLDLSEIINN